MICCLFVFFLPLLFLEKGEPFSANSLDSTPISEEKLLFVNPFIIAGVYLSILLLLLKGLSSNYVPVSEISSCYLNLLIKFPATPPLATMRVPPVFRYFRIKSTFIPLIIIGSILAEGAGGLGLKKALSSFCKLLEEPNRRRFTHCYFITT